MKTKTVSLALMEGKILFGRFFGGQKDWNDSRTSVLDSKKIAAPKKNCIFADGFLLFTFEKLETFKH